MTETRRLRLEEDDGRWSELLLPVSRPLALVQAALGVVAAAPDSDGRTRTIERLQAGVESAALLAADVLREALADGR